MRIQVPVFTFTCRKINIKLIKTTIDNEKKLNTGQIVSFYTVTNDLTVLG